MKKIVFITPREAEYGFRLAGVTQHTVTVEDAENVLKRVLGEPDTGLVAIDERLIKGIDEKKLRGMEEKWYGILLILPAPKRPALETEDYALQLIRRTIGYYVRVKV